jgi:autotransporter-associated beta strand protein
MVPVQRNLSTRMVRSGWPVRSRTARWAALVAIVGIVGHLPPAAALDVTGYAPTVNDRFASGFPLAPVPNTSGSFVGQAYDWSGVAWSTTTYAASSYKGFAMLSPRHFLTAQHYENGGLLTSGVRLRTNAGTIVSQTNQGIDNLGYGPVLTNQGVTAPDLALGTLAASIAAPAVVARYGVLDLYPSSSSTQYSLYDNLAVVAYGRGATTNGSPRAAATSVNQTGFITSATQTVILTLATGPGSVKLVEGDSGSPLMHGWTNPNGGQELAVLGLNSAVDSTYNYMSFLAVPGAMANANAVMTPDGYALRVVGNSSATWQGGSGGPSTQDDLSRAANWSSNSIPSDLYVLFSGTTATVRAVDVNAATNLRGLSFKATGTSGDGFSFSGASTLTIGRGGVTNYDADRQTISAALTLGDDQYWDVGSGGVTAGAIATNGNLLEIAGSGTARITGVVSGSGGIALTGSRLELTGASTYTGATWVHAGLLVVNGSASASSGVTVDAAAMLGGTGIVAAIGGAGTVAPGASPGILTAPSVNVSAGLDFAFEFTGTGSPVYGTGTASGNDVLRLTGTTPFSQSLTASNAIAVFLDVPSLVLNDVFRGGFFTDRDADFLAGIKDATYAYYVADVSGTTVHGGKNYSLYAGSYTFDVTTVAETAAFAGGTETGYVTQFSVVPEPAAAGLLAVAIACLTASRAVRRGLIRRGTPLPRGGRGCS